MLLNPRRSIRLESRGCQPVSRGWLERFSTDEFAAMARAIWGTVG